MQIRTLFAVVLLIVTFALTSMGAPAPATVEELLRQWGPYEKSEPARVIDEYSRFFRERQPVSPDDSIRLALRLVGLYYDGRKDAQTAVQLCDWALTRYPERASLASVVMEKVRILRAEKRPEEAQQALDAFWGRLAAGQLPPLCAALDAYCALVEREGGPPAVIEALTDWIRRAPLLLCAPDERDPRAWITPRLVVALVERNRPDEALRYAKAAFLVSAFNEAALTARVRLIARALSLKDREGGASLAFARWQPGAAAPNPLAAVALPEVDAQACAAQLAQWTQPEQVGDRVGLRLVQGDLAGAMVEACRPFAAGDARTGAAEVCRVLKAADFGVTRANAFLEYLRTGQGANPVEAFFAEHPGAAAAAGAVGAVAAAGGRFAGRAGDLPQPLRETLVGSTTLLRSLMCGAVKEAEVAESGLVKAAEVVQALGWNEKPRLGPRQTDPLASLLVNQYPEQLEGVNAGTSEARLRVVDYLRKKRDPRALPLAQRLAEDAAAGQVHGSTLNVPGLAFQTLGDVYAMMGDHLRAAQASEEAGHRMVDVGYVAWALVTAGRRYRLAGDDKKMEAMYAEVARTGHADSMEAARNDLVSHLVGERKYDEARRLVGVGGSGEAEGPLGAAGLTPARQQYYVAKIELAEHGAVAGAKAMKRMFALPGWEAWPETPLWEHAWACHQLGKGGAKEWFEEAAWAYRELARVKRDWEGKLAYRAEAAICLQGLGRHEEAAAELRAVLAALPEGHRLAPEYRAALAVSEAALGQKPEGEATGR
ncbi:MAG: hypothetical protein HY321_06325 [Armatimonadetes bacterium]|nr:hypothetical protein [Armatimonadota bacterium]